MNLRILIDMNISPQWVKSFSNFGIEAIHWSSIGVPNATDQEID
jgi:predicted nuclease of predicted toxin-antitoxin system